MKTRTITTLAMTLLAGGLVTSCDSKATNTPPEKAEVKEAADTPTEKTEVKEATNTPSEKAEVNEATDTPSEKTEVNDATDTPTEKTEVNEVSPATQKLIEAIRNYEYWKYEDCIKEGADVNASYNGDGTLLSRELATAHRRGKYDGAKILIKNGADINRLFYDYRGILAPLWEVYLGMQFPYHREELISFFEWLLKNDIELKPGGFAKNTPIHVAAMRGFHGVLMTLQIQGAETNCLNADGKTPLDVNVNSLCINLDWVKNWNGPIDALSGRTISLRECMDFGQHLFTTLEVLMISGADPNIWHEEKHEYEDRKIQVNAITRIMQNFTFNNDNYPLVLKQVYKARKPYHRDKNGLNLFENYLMSNVSDKTISGNQITTRSKDRFFLELFISDGIRISDPKALELLKKDGELYYQYKKEQGIK